MAKPFKDTFCQIKLWSRESEGATKTFGSELDGPVERLMVLEIKNSVINQITDKQEAVVRQVAENTLVDILETFVSDHNKSLNWKAVRHAARILTTTMQEDDGDCNFFEHEIIWVETSDPIVKTSLMMAVRVDKHIPSAASLLASLAKKKVSEAARHSVLSAPPSPFQSAGGSSPSGKKNLQNKDSLYHWQTSISLECDERRTLSKRCSSKRDMDQRPQILKTNLKDPSYRRLIQATYLLRMHLSKRLIGFKPFLQVWRKQGSVHSKTRQMLGNNRKFVRV